MAKSEAQIRANVKYESKAYDKILVRLKKGEREKISATAEASGNSLNGYIVEAIYEKMSREQQ